MYRITLPFAFNGDRYGIKFTRGIGFTDNDIIADKLAAKGIKVEKGQKKSTRAARKPRATKTDLPETEVIDDDDDDEDDDEDTTDDEDGGNDEDDGESDE